MTRALVALLLVLANVSVDAAPRRRAVEFPTAPVAPAAIVQAATQAGEAALAAGVPAIQIAVSHHGQIIYSEAFGLTDRVTATAATPRSVLRVGSITKQFTAAGILRLAERGALTLDDRIEKYVPEFDPRGRTITLRHLLTHTSGVARDPYLPTMTPSTLSAPYPRAHAIAALNSKPFDFTPGSKWSYSNSGFLLLGYAIESITGTPYPEFVHNEFALPLGLLDTGVCGTFNLPLPAGYSLIEGQWMQLWSFHTSGMISSGALCSTASDLTRWAHLLANGYVMLPASYAAMTTPARLNNDAVVPGSYALGVSAQEIHGHPAVSHGGIVTGFFSFLIYLSDQEMAIAVITNAFPNPTAGHAEIVARAIAKAAVAQDAVGVSSAPSASSAAGRVVRVRDLKPDDRTFDEKEFATDENSPAGNYIVISSERRVQCVRAHKTGQLARQGWTDGPAGRGDCGHGCVRNVSVSAPALRTAQRSRGQERGGPSFSVLELPAHPRIAFDEREEGDDQHGRRGRLAKFYARGGMSLIPG